MNKERWLLIAVAAIILILSLTIFRTTINNLLILQQEIVNNKKSLATLENKSKILAAIDDNELKRKVQLVEEIFPSQKPVLDLIASLQQLAVNQNVIFSGIELRPGQIAEQETGERKEFGISFRVAGNLKQIAAFISELERTPPPMKIEQMDLKLVAKTEAEKTSGETTTEPETETISAVEVNLTVTVYYQAVPATLGTIEKPVPQLTNNELITLKKIETFNTIPVIQEVVTTGKEDLFGLP
jgi:Tfp pilus assembly protein PilO